MFTFAILPASSIWREVQTGPLELEDAVGKQGGDRGDLSERKDDDDEDVGRIGEKRSALLGSVPALRPAPAMIVFGDQTRVSATMAAAEARQATMSDKGTAMKLETMN